MNRSPNFLRSALSVSKCVSSEGRQHEPQNIHRRQRRCGTAHPLAAQVPQPPMAPHTVNLTNEYPVGQIHVAPDSFQLFWTLGGGQARVYQIRIGRDDLYEQGEFYVGAKKEWPAWTPTPGMIEREPERYARCADGGMEGGPGNPMGARALYLFQESRGDTFLRIHGTDDPASIGQAVSNGCAGLTNEHIVDLYELVPLGTPVFLHPKTRSEAFQPAAR